jgi:hypothetical protein
MEQPFQDTQLSRDKTACFAGHLDSAIYRLFSQYVFHFTFTLKSIFIFIALIFTASMQTEQVGQGDSWPLERNDQECPTCTRERTVSVMKDDDIKRWRIESTKQQILDRLEMEDRPPRVKTKDVALHMHSLPPTIVLPDSISSPYQIAMEVEPARQIILFPTKTFRRNKINKNHHNDPPPPLTRGETLTLKFPITDEMLVDALQSAVLWTAQETSSNNSASGMK